ncbi:uncharacterized protein LOC123272421 [Cotesia glomerata]|uniref:Uncharacterized protein n=1 Tax=Cotesia glomerata TaxID=32391 RepID=A0AAV7J405_COTGL|nr:uncharacterized protein LOC123272421 [Cotesia glomerata]KAH0564665.1 hypothetical protein KQX54_013364 [Cotesia glomerata]
MPCDGKNPNCDRRRELLSQLKCLVSSMDRKKPCEWDEPPCPPPACVPDTSGRDPTTHYMPIKAVKSVNFRGSVMYRCECIKRNGLQDRCMMMDCMGRPECTTKLYPMCHSGRAALLKLTDLGDTQTALEKFYAADKARESALAAYYRLVCPETNGDGSPCAPPLFISPPSQTGYQQQCEIPDCQPCHQSPEDQYRQQKPSSFPCHQGPGDQLYNQNCQPCYQSTNQHQSYGHPQPQPLPVQRQLPYQSCQRGPGDYYQSFYQQNPRNQDIRYPVQRNQPQCPYQSPEFSQFQPYQPQTQSAPCMVPNYVHC